MADPRQMIIEIIYDDDKGTPVLKSNSEAVKKYGKELKAFEKQLQNTAPKQQQLGKTTQATNLAMMDAGRILQDLPYGIRGVANNIDPMIQSFQRLQKQTGSSGAALKALLGSLTGPAGIAIGVSAVTSLLVAFGPQIKEFFSNFGEGAKDVEKAKEEIESLFKVAGNVGEKLGLTDTEALSGIQDILGLFTALEDIGEEYNKLQGDGDSQFGITSEKDLKRAELLRGVTSEINVAISEQTDFVKNLSKTQRDSILERITKLKEEAELRENIKQLIIDSLGAEKLREIGEGLAAEARSSIELIAPDYSDVDLPDSDLPNKMDFSGMIDGGKAGAFAIDSLTNALQRYGYTLQEIKGMSEETGRQFLKDAIAAEQLSNVVSSGLVNAMGQGAEAIGALASGNATPEELFGGFKLLFADFLSTFGQQLIALGIGKISLDNLFKSIGGGPAAIAAGVALVAAAGAVRSSAQNQLGNITSSGSTGNVIVGYRGATVPSGANEQGLSFPKNVAITLNDGFGGIVARGTMELDRKGQKIYTGG
ncbi:MAG: hypothetical protein JJ958_06795 [Balneola sp.]|nr:hypothetical protein [Balneola sp.]